MPRFRPARGSAAASRRGAAEPPKFGSQDYWESFYAGETQDANEFEWFCGYDMVQPFVHEFILPLVAAAERVGERPRLLVAGCGNSQLGNELYDDLLDSAGAPRLDLWNVDYAPAAIARSAAAAGERRMRHVVADLRKLPHEDFPDGSVDVVLDKGAFDAVICTGRSAVSEMASELRRVVRADGRVFIVSGVATAEDLLSAFAGWDVELDGSPYITEDGDATIGLCARLYVFRRREV